MKLELIKDIKKPKAVSEAAGGSGMDQVVSTEGAARILGVSDSRIRQFVQDGRLTPVEKTDSDHYFKRADVEALAKKPRERTGRPKGSETKDKKSVSEGVESEVLEGSEVHTHEVVERGSNKVVGKYKSVEAARRGRDKKDNAYGSYKHSVRKIGEDKDIV